MNTFQKEITFLTGTIINSLPAHKPVTKTFTFNELDRTIGVQHKLHFKITNTFRKFDRIPIGLAPGEEPEFDDNGEAKQKYRFEPDDESIYDLTVRFINEMYVKSGDTTLVDKKELLADSGALYAFGFWLLGEKIAPFFVNMQTT